MEMVIAPLLMIAAILYTAWPLLEEAPKQRASRRVQGSREEKLLEEKEIVITNLKDVEMDYRMGKLSSEDYESLKTDLENRAVELLRMLERLKKKVRQED